MFVSARACFEQKACGRRLVFFVVSSSLEVLVLYTTDGVEAQKGSVLAFGCLGSEPKRVAQLVGGWTDLRRLPGGLSSRRCVSCLAFLPSPWQARLFRRVHTG